MPLTETQKYEISRYGWDALEVTCGLCKGDAVIRNEDNDLIDCPKCGGTGIIK